MSHIFKLSLLASLLVSSTAFADQSKEAGDQDDGFSRYNINLAGSLFGPSANFGYNASRKTTYVFAMGAFSGNAPIEPEVDGVSYKMSGQTTWVGVFLNHRPVEKAQWFRIVAGLGIGHIENDIEDGDGNIYRLTYNENPAGYLGVGFGLEAKKGFLWGVDFGVLQTGGATVEKIAGTGSNEREAIRDHWVTSSLLPNFQVSIGYGF